MSYDELKDLVVKADAAGHDIHIHAIGDLTITQALDAFEEARIINGPRRNNTHTICHVQVIQESDIKRFGELNVYAQHTPIWYIYYEPALKALGEAR